MNMTRRSVLVMGISSCALPGLTQAAPTSSQVTPDLNDPAFWARPRVIRVKNMNTGQGGEFEYWKDGQYVMDRYFALSALALDHRAGVAVQIDPRVFDLMYATQTWFEGATKRQTHHELTSAYRTPATNKAVGGAPSSTHLQGRAMDGRMDGVSLSVYAAMLLAFRAGGVGLYERHVHWDVGRSTTFWRTSGAET